MLYEVIKQKINVTNDGDNSNATCIVNRKSASCIIRVWITRI